MRVFKMTLKGEDYLILSEDGVVIYSDMRSLMQRTLADLRGMIPKGASVRELHDLKNSQEVEVKVNNEWIDIEAQVIGFTRGTYKVIIELPRNKIRPK